jgi:hypothetical protein
MLWAMPALNTVKLLKAFLSPKQPAHRRPKRQRKKSFLDNLVCPEAGGIPVSQGGHVFTYLPGAHGPEVLVWYVPIRYVPVRFPPVRYYPIQYIPSSLCPRRFHPWNSQGVQNNPSLIITTVYVSSPKEKGAFSNFCSLIWVFVWKRSETLSKLKELS